MDLKKILPIAIIVVAVLALVTYAAFKPSAAPQAPITTQAPTAGAGAPTGGATNQAPSASQAPAESAALPADTKPVSSKEPATVVPAGMTLDQFCDKYYKAWLSKDWKTAYDMQPYAKKSQGDVNSFAQSREGYGLTGATVQKPVITGNVATVVAEMNLGPNGTWTTNWTFVKNDKGEWTVYDSKAGMMGGQ